MNDLPSARELPHHHQETRRKHLISEMTRTPTARRVAPLRLAIGGLATTGVAIGAAMALIVIPSGKVGGNAPLERAKNASDVLSLASTAAARQPELKPRPDQYLYFESESLQTDAGQPKVANRRKVWLPVDGRRAGLLLNEGDEAAGEPRTWLCDDAPKNGAATEGLPKLDLENPPSGCRTKAAFRQDLPTSGAAMRTWLYRHSLGGNPPDVQAYTTVFDTLRESYSPPAALSAMFAAAAKLPGVTVTGNAKDIAGRRGIAVGQTWHGIRRELIFDPKTYQMLGERAVVSYDASFRPSGGKGAGKPWTPDRKQREGTVLFSSAILKIAVTDKAGQPPTR
jgi:hypothetical protein